MSAVLSSFALTEEVVEVSQADYFVRLFSPEALLDIFFQKFSETRSKGIDRVNGFQFYSRAVEQISIASRKCLDGTYRFAPYLENLKSKGRGKAPRLIAIPTIRDRIVLHQLNKFLAFCFPERVPKNIANSVVRQIISRLHDVDPSAAYICGCDIKDFYGAIDIERAVREVSKRVDHRPALSLVRRALLTPTVPRNFRRKNRSGYSPRKGVPQGLAISNILASIYVGDIDRAMENIGVSYFRYVDDILMLGSEDKVRRAYKSLRGRMRHRQLALHPLGSSKTYMGPASKRFGYLGYTFAWPKVTVRDETVERLLISIAAQFSDFIHNSDRRLERFSYLTKERLAQIFLDELNERIAGAVSEGRRYGWIAYFSQVTDLALLHRLDHAVAGMFSRLDAFSREPPEGLKKFRRAYYEIKYNPLGGYVRDYDSYTTFAQKLQLLEERGRVAPNERLTDEQINSRFLSYRRRVLSKMHADEDAMYG